MKVERKNGGINDGMKENEWRKKDRSKMNEVGTKRKWRNECRMKEN